MRKTADITITDEGRDKGKVFRLREMSAMQAEKWAARALLALAKSGVDIPDEISEMGMAGMVALGIKSLVGVSFRDAEPLLDEMLGCIKIVPDPARPQIERPLIDGDIEEVRTLVTLRKEVFTLHTGFSLPAAP